MAQTNADIKFYYLASKNEYNKITTKDSKSLYFVKGVGIYRGTELIADDATTNSAEVTEALGLLLAAIEENAKNISTNTKNIETINQDIDKIEGAVGTNTANIVGLGSELNTQIEKIEKRANDIVGYFDSLVAKNAEDIKTNADQIALNKSSIGSLSGELQSTKNALALKADSSTVTSLKGTVDSHTTTIKTQGTAITELESTVKEHTATLETQKGAISDLGQDLEDEATAREAADSALDEKISTNAKNIKNNSDDILDLEQSLGNKVDTSTFNAKVSELNTAIGNKADKTTVNNLSATVTNLSTTVAGKANTTDVNSALAKKADTQTVNAALALKADKTTVDNALAGKASTGTTTSLQNQINSLKNTEIADLQERVGTNENTLETLTADEDTSGSVKQQVNEAIVTLIGGAPEAMNSLQKLIDWLGGYGDNEAEVMMSNLVHLVQIHDSQIGTLNGDLSGERTQREAADSVLDGKIVETNQNLTNTNQTIAGVRADLTAEEGNRKSKDEELKGLIDANGGKITSNTSQINTIIQSTIPGLSSRVDVNVQKLTSHDTLIETNQKNIKTNQENIATNTDTIAKHTGDIAKNAAAIAKNTAAIEKETGDRAAADAELDGKINELEKAHEDDVSSLEGQIGAEAAERKRQDDSLKDYIDGCVSDLAAADEALSGRIDINEDNIGRNASDIDSLQNTIAQLQSEISNLQSKLDFIWNNFIVNNSSVSSAHTQALKIGPAVLEYNPTDESVDVTFN